MVSISSALAAGGDVWDSKFPMAMVPYENMYTQQVKDGVNRTIAEVMSWSLKACATGLFPDVGPFGLALDKVRMAKAGAELCGGWKACYFGFRADGKARKESQMFERSYLHSFICEKCLAQRPHKGWEPLMHYKNFDRHAAYRLTALSHGLSQLLRFPQPRKIKNKHERNMRDKASA